MTDDDDLGAEVRKLRSEVDALQHRVGRLESRLDGETPFEGHRPGESDSVDARSGAGDTPAAAADHDRNWERDIGTKWLGRVGSVALVFGAVFFIRVAIEAGILGPLGRVAAGAAGGTALLAGGRYAARHRGYKRWGRVTAGTGLAIAFFSVYAAYGFESYRTAIGTPLWGVLLALTVLVGATVVVSVFDSDPLVAGEAFLLGYVTAYLGLDAGSFVVTPAYALLLAVGLVGIAGIRPWGRHVTASVPLTYGLVVAWAADLDPGWGAVAGVTLAGFATYIAGRVVLGRNSRTDAWTHRLQQALTPLNAAFAAPLLEWTTREWLPELPVEGVAVAVIAVALAGVYAATSHRSTARDDAAGTAAVVLFGVSVVVAAGTFSATVGLLAITCGAVAATWYGAGDPPRRGAHLVAAGTAGKLLAVDAGALPGLTLADPLATATGRPAAFLLVITVFYGLAWWFRGDTLAVPRRDDSVGLAVPYLLAATTLTVVGLGLELSGFGLSVAWAAFGAALLGGGLRSETRAFRLQGVAVFGVTTAKAFLFDTQGLDPVARTISFLVLGSSLLAASYAYARRQGDRPLDRLREV
ncbi:hypothetical protein GCM10008995_14360 [Halobellus salinus]|uniref:DUF2339 domain-containing protein n=1 Tax=Halobellus salinus TaxID=931585 RepID=A0A830EAA7_9EURY|nr:DUF2339 domain-containing protein [Halobellus salinus]GGJ05662.1 hypothetical protein GCM10008995_14360 [Halobellus salinus]SMP23715.1 Predicted membrane protein [Halobellus salinus]